jgi:hypothetical protein
MFHCSDAQYIKTGIKTYRGRGEGFLPLCARSCNLK